MSVIEARAEQGDAPLLAHLHPADTAELSPIEREFMSRVLSTPQENYAIRLAALGLGEGDRILDAGCGFGQWSQAMGRTFRHVVGVDTHHEGLRIARRVADSSKTTNLDFQRGTIEALPYRDGAFDAVFSYSCLYFTDFPRTLLEFHRVLAPGGRLYVCTNSYGWFLQNLLRPRHATEDYSPRRYAMKTFRNALTGRVRDLSLSNGARVTSRRVLRRLLSKIGFEILALAGEGRIRIAESDPFAPNYAARFLGFDNVIEILARKESR